MRLSRAVAVVLSLAVPLSGLEFALETAAFSRALPSHTHAFADTLTVTVRGLAAHATSNVAGNATSNVAGNASSTASSAFTSSMKADGRASPLAVVLIPGPIGSAFSMRHITDALAAESVPTIVIDPLGMGTSSRPASADYSLTRQALRIAAILDTLHVSRVLVVGQGTSASIALHLAASDTVRVQGVLSLAGGPVDKQGTRGVRLALTLSPLLDNALGRAIGRKKFRNAVRDQSASMSWCTDSVMRVYLGPYERDLRGSLRALRAMNDAVEPVPLAERLGGIRVPVRLLVGDKVSANAPTAEQIHLMQRSLPAFAVDTVAKAGTMLQEERPDAVLAAVRSMMRASKRP